MLHFATRPRTRPFPSKTPLLSLSPSLFSSSTNPFPRPPSTFPKNLQHPQTYTLALSAPLGVSKRQPRLLPVLSAHILTPALLPLPSSPLNTIPSTASRPLPTTAVHSPLGWRRVAEGGSRRNSMRWCGRGEDEGTIPNASI